MAIERKDLPRTIRGGRHFFFDDPATDKLVAMVIALSGEVWVLRERLAAVEGVAAAAGTFSSEDVERYEFSSREAAQLGDMRREFIGNLFRVLDETVAAARLAGESRAAAKTARKVPPRSAARKSGRPAAGTKSAKKVKTTPRNRSSPRAKRPAKTATRGRRATGAGRRR